MSLNDRLKLKQLRDGIARKIAENPSAITYSRTALVSDGFEGYVTDPYGTPTEYSDTIRITHEHNQVQDLTASPVGASTSFGLFAMMKYTSTIDQGDVLTDGTTVYKVGPVDTFERFGGVYLKLAPLTIVTEGETSS